jgi:PAS domain S-box-containing protein
MKDRIFKSVTGALVLALAYFAMGRLGLMFPAFGSSITLLWLPTGIAVAGLLRLSFRCWPAISLGAVAVNYSVGLPIEVALVVAVGNTLGPVVTASVLQRVGFRPAFERHRDIVILAGGAVAGMMIPASVGVASLALAGLLPDQRLAAWFIWLAGDTMGVIFATPLLLNFTRRELREVELHSAEFVGWFAATCAAVWGVFVWNRGSVESPWALAFLPLPTLAWAALRFGPVGTSVGLIVLSLGAVYGTATGGGPFIRPRPIDGAVNIWAYMATSAVMGWLISAVHQGRLRSANIQRLLERALGDVSLGVLLAGLDRLITYANQGFTRLTGYKERELLGQSCSILQGPGSDPVTVQKLKEALHGDGNFDGEILNYRKDGSTFWNALIISPVHDESGAKTGFLGIQRDITKRKQAEQALQQSEEHLRTIVELEPECVKIVSPDGRLLEMNPAGLAMLDATSFDEVRGFQVSDFIVPEDRAGYSALHKQALQGGTGRCGFSIMSLKGVRRRLETHAVPYRNARREIVGVLAITRDVTEMKLVEEALRDSEDRFRRLIDYAPEAIVLLNVTTGRLIQVNPAAERLFKLTGAELCRVGPVELSPPNQPDGRSSADASREFIMRALAGEAPRFEWTHRDSEGREIPCEVRLLRLEIGGHAVVRGSVTDISDRKAAEEALREREERLRAALSASGTGTFRWNTRTNEFSCDHALDSLLGLSPGKPVETLDHFIATVHPDDRPGVIECFERCARQGTDFGMEFRVNWPDASLHWLDTKAKSFSDPAGRPLHVTGACVDITERKRTEQSLLETQKLESLGVLAGGIAHDFNNLLTGIIGNASLVRADLPPDSPLIGLIEPINDSAQQAADLCRQMLAYSGKGRFVVQKADLSGLVEETTKMLQHSISKKAELRFQLEPGLPPIEADTTQIRQVIMNLVINASEALGDEGGIITLTTGRTTVAAGRQSGAAGGAPGREYVFLKVTDTGCGMDVATQSKIFEPFFTTKFTGRGLGLAAVQGIIKGHKGELTVESEPGRGTTFQVMFPAVLSDSGVRPVAPSGGAAWRGSGRILIVDDEATIRNTLSRMLTVLGFSPVLAMDGAEAVGMFRAAPSDFALVLLDLTMPRLSGEQTLVELRKIRDDVRVVVMSGYNRQEALVQFTGKGVANFLQKPFTVDALRAVLSSSLE